MKKYLIIVTYLLPIISFANININEVMYDLEGSDSGYEWIEVYNGTNEGIDLTEYTLVENSKNHKIKHFKEEKLLPQNSYAVIADNPEKFMEKYPSFNGYLFDSVFSLNNKGEEIILVDKDGNEIDKVLYNTDLGGKGDGTSLQINEGVWIGAIETPGKENSKEKAKEKKETKEEVVDNTSSHSSQVELSNQEEKILFKIGAGRGRLASVNSPVEFEIVQTELVGRVRYSWSFGDGSKGMGKKVKHAYKYPGVYNVVVNGTSYEGEAVTRTIVNVIESKLDVSIKNNLIEIINQSNYEYNLGGYIIKNNSEIFKIPEDTIILKKGSIILDEEILEFEIIDNLPVEIYYPNQNLFKIILNEKQVEILKMISDLCQEILKQNIQCNQQKLEHISDII